MGVEFGAVRAQRHGQRLRSRNAQPRRRRTSGSAGICRQRAGKNRSAVACGWLVPGFGPRLGVAYAVNPKTVAKGSFSIYYAPGFRTRLIAYGFNNGYKMASPSKRFNWLKL